MRTSHLLGIVATAAFALLTPNASAFTNVTTGDPVTAFLTSPTFAQGSFTNCTGSTLAMTVTQDAGPGAGGALEIHTASFSGCTSFGSPVTWTPDTSTPWPVTINGAGTATMRNFNYTQRWGSLWCQYSGDLMGAYNQATGQLVLSGSVTRRNGSSLCPSTAAISASYNVRSATTNAYVTL